jgi:hypothetical protein
MKYRLKFTYCLCFVFFGIEAFLTPKIGMALEPVVVGVLHSEKFPYATMIKNSFEMALEVRRNQRPAFETGIRQ